MDDQTHADYIEPLLGDLNGRQREAVTAPDGPVLVLAGPGSGKTKVICTRIAYLVLARGVPAGAVAAVTFTRKAAKEMEERVGGILGPIDAEAVQISTFHSLCGRILRRDGERVGVPRDFSIVTGRDQTRLMAETMIENDVNPRALPPRAVLKEISHAKNHMQPSSEPSSYSVEGKRTAMLATSYQAKLAANGAVDFDDMLLKTVELFHEHPDVRERHSRSLAHVLVDEYQDTNLPQYVLVHQLTRDSGNVFAVGDPDQAIYGWRGAELNNILNFEHDFAGAQRVDLKMTYRSTGSILAAANALINNNTDRVERSLETAAAQGERPRVHRTRDATTEAQYAVTAARERIDRDNGTVSVLYRTNAQSRAMEAGFRSAGIPYRISGGTSFYERAEIQDALSCLYVAADPRANDGAAERFLTIRPKTPLDKADRDTIRQLPATGAASGRATYWNRTETAVAQQTLSPRKQETLEQRLAFATRLQEAAARLPLEKLVDFAVDDSGLRNHLRESNDPHAKERLENLSELANDAANFEANMRNDDGDRNGGPGGETVLEKFLQHTQQMIRARREGEERETNVTLSTLHSAKGLEFDTVILAGFDKERLPHKRTLKDAADTAKATEEERRLAYVGMTRARTELHITVPSIYGSGDRKQLTSPSPFLADIPRDLLDHGSAPKAPETQPPNRSEHRTPERMAAVAAPAYSH